MPSTVDAVATPAADAKLLKAREGVRRAVIRMQSLWSDISEHCRSLDLQLLGKLKQVFPDSEDLVASIEVKAISLAMESDVCLKRLLHAGASNFLCARQSEEIWWYVRLPRNMHSHAFFTFDIVFRKIPPNFGKR